MAATDADPFGLALDRIRTILNAAIDAPGENCLIVARMQLKTALQALDEHDMAAALAFAEDAIGHLRKAVGR